MINLLTVYRDILRYLLDVVNRPNDAFIFPRVLVRYIKYCQLTRNQDRIPVELFSELLSAYSTAILQIKKTRLCVYARASDKYCNREDLCRKFVLLIRR